MVGVREIDLMTASLPRSMRLAMATSPSRVSSGHRAHLAQVHADGIVGLVEGARREIELGAVLGAVAIEVLVAAVRLVGIDDLDAGAAERVEQVVEVFRRGDLRREHLVDLVVEQVALFLADLNQLAYFVVLFFNRQGHSPPDPQRLGPTSRCFNPLYQVVLPNQQFLQLLALVPADFLQPIDLALDRRALPLAPEPLDDPDAAVGVVHVRFAFARDGGHELGVHRA